MECDAPDVGTLLERDDWRDLAASASGPVHELSSTRFLAVVPSPRKIICVGLNYKTHILEMGRELPAHPTLFAKFPETLIGPFDDIAIPGESSAVDWEAELAVVVGKRLRHADASTAAAGIAGYSVINDVTMRDWQFRTKEWLQGKNFEATAPLGPYLATTDEVPQDALLRCQVDGETRQEARISDLLFSASDLLSYISSFITLYPGDVIATGTPGGVGHARTPPLYLEAGQTLITSLEGVGEMVNRVVRGDDADG